MTALTVFFTETAASTVATADTLLANPTTGATLSNKNTNLTSGTTGWVEVWSQGNASAQTGAGSQPAPTGHGWLLDSTLLESNHFPAGTWTVSHPYETTTSGTFVADFHYQFYQRSSGGTYTLIGEAVDSGQTITSGSFTTISASVSASASATFATGDKLYIHVTANLTTNGTTGNLRMQASNSATLGSTSAQVVTPGYISVTTSSRTIPATAALITTNSRTIPSTAALLATNNRTIPATAALITTNNRTIPATADIALTSSRTIPTTACLDQPVSRTIPATAALITTNSRTIPSTVALITTSSRTIPTTATLLTTSSRTIPATAALDQLVSRTIPATTALLTTNIRTIPTTATLTNTFARVIPTSAALYVPAVFHASNVTQTVGGLTQSDQMSQVPGGAETSVAVTMPSSGANAYVELLAQGGTATGTSSLPAPTGKGWSISLQGYTILAGSWFSAFTLAKSASSMSGARLIVRWYRRTMDGTYYPIGVSTLTGQTFSAKATYTTPTVTVNFPWQFIANDTLYMDAFVLNPTTAWASDVFTVYISNSATQGVYNDGIIVAPTVISTPAGLSCLVSASSFQTGVSIPVKNESFTLTDMIDQRSVLNLTGEDVSGNLSFVPNMPVILSDSIQGKIYDGYLASDQMSKVSADPSILQREHRMTFADHHRDYDKEANGILGVNTNGTNYLNWSAGDIACDFIDKVESNNGIWGDYAIEADYSQSAFALGTLSGTAATSTTSPFTYAPNTATPPITTNTGDLELTRAGTQFILTESVTSDFASGTLTNMTASSNALKPTTQSAMRFVAQFPLDSTATNQLSSYQTLTIPAIITISPSITKHYIAQEGINNFCRAKVWAGSQVVGTFDTLNYDIWIASTSPGFTAIVNLLFNDGTFLSSYGMEVPDDPSVSHEGVYDQNGVSSDPLTDLSSYAKDTWYTRAIPLNLVTGKTITAVEIEIQGSAKGTYTVYIKNCYLGSVSGSPFFSTTAITTQYSPVTLSVAGGYLAYGTGVDVVQVYQPALSRRVSPAHSISSVGLVQNSKIIWTAALPFVGATNIVYPPGTTAPLATSSSQTTMNIYVSYDGSTWLLCTNLDALPGLPPGTNVSGLSLYLLEQFQCGSDPTALPSLLNVTVTINSAAAQTTTDVVASYSTTAEWNTGTYSGTTVNANGNLINGGTYTPDFTIFGYWEDKAGSGTLTATSSTTLTYTDTVTTATSDMVLAFTDVLPMTNGTIECDVSITDTGTNQWARTGVMYRASDWNTGWDNSGSGDYSTDYNPPMTGYLVYIWYDTTGANLFVSLQALHPIAGSTNIATVTETIVSGTTYHLKVVFENERHIVYFNHGAIPVIDMSDSTYLGAGGVGLYAMGTIGDSTTVHYVSKWSNLSVTPLAAGTWTSPSLSLAGLGTCGYTQIAWSEIGTNGTPQSTATVLSSLDGGTTWERCYNKAEIPLLTPGTSVSSLLIRIAMFSNPGITTPSIIGLYARVCGHYGTVTGTRISPVLNLSPVTYESSSNVMYNSNTPTGTSIAVATSINAGSSWESVPNSGAGAALSYWTPQPSPTQDLFNTNTLANYTNTNKTGGSAASVLYTTTQSQLSLSGGSFGLYLSNSPASVGDIEVACCLSQSDTGGLVWHYTNGSNYYELVIYDASSSGGSQNALQLYKISSNVRTLLGTTSIVFTRGTFHIPKIIMKGGLINAYWDGQCILSYLDTSPLGSGLAGLRNNGGIALFYQLWIQPLGTNLSGAGLQTKAILSTSDPQYMPQLFVLACAVRGPHITQGVQISEMHPLTVPFAAYYSTEMDQLAQADGDSFWYVDRYGECYFQSRYARLGAFPLQTITDPADASGSLLYTPPLKVTTASDTFRNQQVITNVTTLVTPPIEYKVADGTATSWTLGYPVHSAPTITFVASGQYATVGIQGVDNGRQIYWQPGSNSLSYDSSLPVLPDGTVFSVQYVGQSVSNLIINNSASQAERQVAEGNSGIVAEIESALRATTIGMTTAQATVFANGLLNRNGVNNAVEVMGTTMYGGLKPGTFVPVFAPEFGVWNVMLPVIKVTTTALPAATGLPKYQFLIQATNGSNQTQWQRVFGIA